MPKLLGTLVALKEKVVSIEEAEKFVFSPYMAKKVHMNQGLDSLVDIIEKGCELEDIESLIPEKLDYNIEILYDETLKLLQQIEKKENDRWIL